MHTFKETKIARGFGRPSFQFEFRAYEGNEDGIIAEHARLTYDTFRSEGAAKAKAGRLAKKIRGPVDLAYAGADEWNSRYITTASPSDFHETGFRFERLA